MNRRSHKENAIHRISNRSRNPPGRLVPAINSKSGSCAAESRRENAEQRHASCNYKKPVFQILCVTGRMTLLCSFCTCPSKNGSSAIGVPFPVFSTHSTQKVFRYPQFQQTLLSSRHPQMRKHASAEPSAEAESKSRRRNLECFRQPSSFLYFTADTKPGRREQKQSAEAPAVHPLSEIRGGKLRHSAKQCSAEEKQITQIHHCQKEFPSLSHHAFQAAVKPAKAHGWSPYPTKIPAIPGRPSDAPRTPRAANAGQSRTSTGASGAVKFCHFKNIFSPFLFSSGSAASVPQPLYRAL